MVTADNLKSAMQTWGLDGGVLDQAYDRVHMAIELALSEAVYFAQGFSYNWEPCQGGGDHPACLATLVVVVKVPDAISDDGAWKAEVGHIYISTAAETLQQWVPWHRCHNCWFKRCCHDGADPRNLDTGELEAVKAVMSTSQAEWSLDHLPNPSAEMSFAKTDVSLSSALDASSSPLWPGLFDNLLRLFLRNPVENGDVSKTYRGGLLAAIQNATLSHRQGFHNMELTVREQGVVPMLDDMLSTCFSKAGIKESTEDWWRRSYVKGQTDPISLECEFAGQRKVSGVPARTGCATSTDVAVNTSYAWGLIAPRDGLFDILFMEGDVSVTFDECVPIKGDDQDGDGEVHTSSYLLDEQESSGTMVRWALVDPSDGSFRSVQYLAKWTEYPSYVTKVVLDFLRLASASSYLKVPIYDMPATRPQQNQALVRTAAVKAPKGWCSILETLRKTLKISDKDWRKAAKLYGCSVAPTIYPSLPQQHQVSKGPAAATDPSSMISSYDAALRAIEEYAKYLERIVYGGRSSVSPSEETMMVESMEPVQVLANGVCVNIGLVTICT